MRQEPHRVYWQQWGSTSQQQDQPQTRRDLLTHSAAVRISDAAKAVDVTNLLRESLKNLEGNSAQDALVLVGTLYNLPPIEYEHYQTIPTSEPVHIVKTLQPQDNPLQVRDALLQDLKQRQRKGVTSPRLQWFFVPASNQIPNCIELDGYCTSVESDKEESSDEDDSDSDSEQDDSNGENWWRDAFLSTRTNDDPLQEHNGSFSSSQHIRDDKFLHREQRRLNQLRNCQSALDRHCVSGFLLKQSNKDPHVWRRVHCVLTDDHLWFVSRLHTTSDGEYRIAKHGRIGLNRALLLEATAEYAPLFRTPHAFEVVSRTGISHAFRAANRALQLRWTRCIADRIVQCHENKILEHAELIVEDEALARNKRLLNVAIQPLATFAEHNDTMRNKVLHWGLDVADYREQCRHIQSRMPAKKPVVVSSEDGNPANPSPRQLFASTPNGDHYVDEGLDVETREMIRAAWDTAAIVLASATQLAKDHHDKKRIRNLETLCRHVDYVITGKFRPLAEAGEASTPERVDRSFDPPPADLFDPLLTELQSLGGSAYKEKANSSSPGERLETPK